MPSWDANRPDANEKWNVGDGRIRDNFSYLQDALQIISTFANNPANPTDGMLGKFAFGNLASRPVMTLAAQTGAVYMTTDTAQLFRCSNGATNSWTEIHLFGEAVTFAAAVTAQTTFTVTGASLLAALTTLGLLTIQASAVLPSGRTLTVPIGENWLTNGTTAFNPHSHGARHRPGATDGAWTAANDFAQYALQRIVQSNGLTNGAAIASTDLAAQAFGAAGIAKCSLTFSTVGRPGVSRGLVWFQFSYENGGTGTAGDRIKAALYLDAIGAPITDIVWQVWDANMPTLGLDKTLNGFAFVTNLSVAAHEIALHVARRNPLDTGASSSVFDMTAVRIMYLDLGTEAGA